MLYDESLIGKQRLQSEVDKECRQLHELIRKTTALVIIIGLLFISSLLLHLHG